IAQRPRALVLVVAVLALAVTGLRSLRDLRDAVRDVAHDVEPREALASEEICRLRIGLAEDRDEDVAAVDLLAPGGLHVRRGALEDALEAEGLLGWRVVPLGQALLMAIEPRAQVATQALDVATARPDHLRDGVVLEQRPEHVLDADVLVARAASLAD